MKFSIKKEILLEALNKVSKAISTKNVSSFTLQKRN